MKLQPLTSLDSLPYFTIEAVKQLLEPGKSSESSIRTALYRWMKSGQVIQLKRGVYMTRRFFEQHRADVDFASAVSAILIPQSYVSLDYILQRLGILTEVTYPVTSVTIKQTRLIENQMGTFTYRNIKVDLYSGFSISNYLGIPFAQASLAKALFDYLYLMPFTGRVRLARYDLAEDLRLNLYDVSKENRVEFEAYIGASQSRKMELILNNLRKTIWRP